MIVLSLVYMLALGCRNDSTSDTKTTIQEEEAVDDIVNDGEFACDPPLQSTQENWSVAMGGAVRLQGSGGSGDYRWIVSEDTPYGFVDAMSGLFTSTSTNQDDVIVQLTDTNCADIVDVVISVTDRFAVSPGYAKVPWNTAILPSFHGGSGEVACEFLINNSQGTLSEDCHYLSGQQDGKDVLVFSDVQTDEFQNVTFDVDESADLDLWGQELILPIGALFALHSLGGSGIFDMSSSDSTTADIVEASILAKSVGTAQVHVTDAHIPDFSATISIQVVEQHGFQSEPWGSRTQYPFSTTYDIDGDGYNELFIANPQGGHGKEPYSGNILVFKGTALGFETNAIQEIGGFYTDEGFGYEINFADLNNDGVGDMVAATVAGGDGGVRIFYGDPETGLLQDIPTMVLHGYGARLCDAGADGVMDIVVGLAGLQGAVYRPVSGMFTPLNIELIDGRASCGDFNADGIVDLLVSKRSYSDGYTYGYFWYMGTEGGAFVPTNIGFDYATNSATGNVAGFGISIKGVDVNGDGVPGIGFLVTKSQLDLWGITAELASQGYTVETGAMLFYDGFETDETLENLRLRAEYDLIVLGEFSKTKQTDDYLFYTIEDDYTVVADFLQLADLADSNMVVQQSDLNHIWTGTSLSERTILNIMADIDDDSLPDFVTLYGNGRNVVFYGYETTTGLEYDFLFDSMASAGERQGSSVAVVQFEGDPQPSLVIGRPIYKTYEPLLVSTMWDGAANWLPLHNEPEINQALSSNSTFLGQKMHVVDINRDGHQELLLYDKNAPEHYTSCASGSYAGYYIFPGSEQGISKQFTSAYQFYYYHESGQYPLGDIDGDGTTDMLSQNSLYGNQITTEIDLYATEANCGPYSNANNTSRKGVTAIGDLDGDGCDEYAQIIGVSNQDGSSWGSTAVYIFYGYGGSTCRQSPQFSVFRIRTGFLQGFTQIASAANFDMDNDGLTDIVLSNETQYNLSSKGAIAFVSGGFFHNLPVYDWDGIQLPSTQDTVFTDLEDAYVKYYKSPDIDSQFATHLQVVTSADGGQHWIAVGRPTSNHAGRESGSWELFSMQDGDWKRTPDLIISGMGTDPNSGMGTVMTTNVINGQTWFAVGQPSSDYIGVDSGAAIGFRSTLVP